MSATLDRGGPAPNLTAPSRPRPGKSEADDALAASTAQTLTIKFDYGMGFTKPNPATGHAGGMPVRRPGVVITNVFLTEATAHATEYGYENNFAFYRPTNDTAMYATTPNLPLPVLVDGAFEVHDAWNPERVVAVPAGYGRVEVQRWK